MKIPLQFFALFLALGITVRGEDPPWKKPEPWDGQGPFAKAEKKTPAQLRGEKIIIPKIELQEVTIREAIELLATKSRQLDPGKKGVNIIAMLGIVREQAAPAPAAKAPEFAPHVPGIDPAPKPPDATKGIPGLDIPGAAPALRDVKPPAPDNGPKITLSLNNVPLTEALKYIANLANLGLRWDEHAAFLWEPEPAVAAKPGAAKAKPAKPRPPVKNLAGKTGETTLAHYAATPVLPKVDFRGTTMREAIEFLVLKRRVADEKGIGMNLVLKLDDTAGERQPYVETLTFTATDIPHFEVLRYVAEINGCDVSFEAAPSYCILITPAVKPAKR